MSIVDSQIKTFNIDAQGTTSVNPFLPTKPYSLIGPTGYKKIHLTSNSNQDFEKTVDFYLPKTDFIGEIYANIYVQYNSSPRDPPSGLAMAAIKEVAITTPSGLIMKYDYKTVMSHLMQVKGEAWKTSAINIATYQEDINDKYGSAVIPTPWSQLVLRNEGPPFPGFLMDNKIQVSITLESKQNLTIDVYTKIPWSINVSLCVSSVRTTDQVRKSLRSLPAYNIFSRDFQTFTNYALTGAGLNTINLSNSFVGTMRSLSLKPQIVTNFSTLKDYWTLAFIYKLNILFDGSLEYQNYSEVPPEVEMDLFTLSFAGAGFTIPNDGSSPMFILPLNGLASENLSWGGGANMSQISTLTVELTTQAEILSVMGEMNAKFIIENKSIRKEL